MSSEATAQWQPAGDRPLDGMRLVVTVRHASLRGALVSVLEHHGAEVYGATLPTDAHRLVFSHRPDVCLIEDLMSDAELSRLAAQVHQTSPDARLIVLENRPHPDSDQPVQHRDVDGLVPRSGDLHSLLDTLVNVLQGQEVPAPPPVPAQRGASGPGLSLREEQVFLLLRSGATNAQIGRTLGISVNTVRTHVHNLLQKLGVNERVQAALLATLQEPGPGSETT